MDPCDLGPNLRERIKARLRAQAEGVALGRIGFCVYVVAIKDEDISMGRLEDSTGQVMYRVSFTGVVLRPFRNEVTDATVVSVNNHGFFASAGPLHIFVSRHMLPDDCKGGYDHERSAWVSDDKEVEIFAGCGIRLRLLSIKFDQNALTAVGTLKDDFLGVITADGDTAQPL